MSTNKKSDRDWSRTKFGLMMHWGLYSVAGGVWKGKNIPDYNEQIKHRAKISWPDYLTLQEGFTAEKWAAEDIVDLAQEGGMKYVVLTTKHHDGFNLWHTALSDFNSVDSTPAKRDVLKELSKACEKKGMNMGLYYSLIDWHYPGALPMSDSNSDPITPALEDYTVGQLRELLTDYGKLFEIWFDMGKPTAEQSRRFTDLVHDYQSQCRISGRIWNGYDDFMECGDNETPDYWFDGPWESSVTMFHETWGYRSWQERVRVEDKIKEKIRDLAFITARGGNYLLNIGPRGDGSIHEYDAEVIKGIGKWMKFHGEAIYKGKPEPHLSLDYGYAVRDGKTLYLYVTLAPANGIVTIPHWLDASAKVSLMTDKQRPLKSTIVEKRLEITLPQNGMDENLPVIQIEFTKDQPYLPQKTITISDKNQVLKRENSLPWHRMEGQDYYSQKKYLVAREWLLTSENATKGKIVVTREKGGEGTGFLLTVGEKEIQFILDESRESQSHICCDISLTPHELTSVKLRHITPRCELKDEGVVLEFHQA